MALRMASNSVLSFIDSFLCCTFYVSLSLSLSLIFHDDDVIMIMIILTWRGIDSGRSVPSFRLSACRARGVPAGGDVGCLICAIHTQPSR